MSQLANDGDGEISLPFEQQTKLTFGSAAVDSKRTTFLLNLLFLQHVFPRSFWYPIQGYIEIEPKTPSDSLKEI